MHAVLNSSIDGGHIEEFTLWPPCLKKGSLYHRDRGLSVSTAGMVTGGKTQYCPSHSTVVPKTTVTITKQHCVIFEKTIFHLIVIGEPG